MVVVCIYSGLIRPNIIVYVLPSRVPILASPDRPMLAPLTNLRSTTEGGRRYRPKSILPPRDSRMHAALQGRTGITQHGAKERPAAGIQESGCTGDLSGLAIPLYFHPEKLSRLVVILYFFTFS